MIRLILWEINAFKMYMEVIVRYYNTCVCFVNNNNGCEVNNCES